MNLYDLVNEEMKRLYADRDYWMNMTLEQPREDRFGKENHDLRIARDKYLEVKEQIDKMRAKIFSQFEDHDKKIQEVIAEQALTGKSDG